MFNLACLKSICIAGAIAACLAITAAAGQPRGNDDAESAKLPTLTNSIGMRMVQIPAGEFLMGSADDDASGRDDERPQHRVRVSKPFYIGAFEVTQAQFEKVTGRNPSFFSNVGRGKRIVGDLDSADFPVEQVTWTAAVEFCRLLSELLEEKRAGRVYRLPTEAEWEYACRAGTTTSFHFGDALSAKQANFNGKHPAGGGDIGPFLARTTKVGSYQPNAFGLYDMHGNVWEWCSDWYGADYYKASPPTYPRGSASGSQRVIRGGCWYSDARDCSSHFRNADRPTDGVYYVLGFRVVMTIGGADALAETNPVGASKSAPVLATTAKSDDTERGVGEDWPQFRGPRGDGTWRGPELPDRWPDGGLERLWRHPIGGGYAGVVAADSRVITMDRQTEPKEVERILCFDANTGKLVWTHDYEVTYGDLSYGNGPRAAPTIHDGRVYSLGTFGHLHCLDAKTGAVIWSEDLLGDRRDRVPMWGLAASPVIFGDLVIVHPGAGRDKCYMAFDRKSGEERWRSVPDPAGYATPILIDAPSGKQMVCWTPKNIHGLVPSSGEVLWSVPFEVTYGVSIATPIYANGIVFVSGYWEGSKAIRLGEKLTDAEVIWEDNRNLRGLMSQPLQRDGRAFLLDKRHGLTCFDLADGNKLWDDQNRMTPKGRNPQATLVWLGDSDRTIVLNSDGELILARLDADGYHEQSRTNIIGETWAHPAYAGNRVFARSDSEIVSVLVPIRPARD